ncbi:NAD(P)H-binding protein [Sphingobacterium lactis]|uniref:NAD(P)H-binding protein n=1 Tax=Sphingobacterium lactis TaxID=797291 RepID=UPI003F7F0FCF
MKAVVIGGTGATGRELVLQLLANPQVESVIALVRRAFFPPDPKLQEIIVDFDRLEEYAAYIVGDVAYSTLGTTLKQAGGKEKQWQVDYEYQLHFARIARRNKIFTFVLLSANQAHPDARIFYSRMKGKLEEAIISLDFPKLIILRPGFIARPNTDRRMEKFSLSIIGLFNKMGLFRKFRPISTVDLADVILNSSLNGNERDVEIWESAKILSFKQTA